jgi:hypothetical protein
MSQANPRRQLLLPVSLIWSLLLLGTLAWIRGGAGPSPLFTLTDPYVGPAAFGALVVHGILCPFDRRRVFVLRAGVLLEILRFALLMHHHVALDVVVFSTGYGFLIAALADFMVHGEWRPAALAALVPVGMASARLGLGDVVQRLTPLTYDGTLLALDATLRIPFSRFAGGLFVDIPVIAVLSLVAYAALPGAIASGLAYEEYANERGLRRGVGTNLLLAYMVSGTIASLLYVLCPATGPSHAFANFFPGSLPDPGKVPLHLAPLAPGAPRNAMPSLHVAWAILLARSVAGARAWVRAAAWVFAALTILATLGSGEHYVFDLVAVAPFLVVLEAATARRSISWRRRAPALVCGGALYALLMIVIRNGTASIPILSGAPSLAWGLAAITVGVPVMFALRPVKSVGRNTPHDDGVTIALLADL